MSEDQEEVKGDNNTPYFIAAVLFCIATPVTILTAVATTLLFTWQRVRIGVLATYLLLPSLILLAIFFQPALDLFMTSWKVTIPSIISQEVEIFPTILLVFAQQIPVAIPLGILIGIGVSASKWKNRPEWEEVTFRSSPLELLKKRKTVKDIQAHKNSPKDGMTLGVSKENGKRIVQTYKESSAHTLILGASGAGKTTTLKARLADSLASGQGCVIVDMKGDPKLAFEIAELAAREGKKLQHWLLQPTGVPYTGPSPDGPAYYDPISRGDATRRKDLIMEMRNWTEDYYRLAAASYLQIVMSVIVGNPDHTRSTLSQLAALLEPKNLQERAIPLGTNPAYYEVVKYIDDMNDTKMDSKEKSNLSSLRSQFTELLMSTAGDYLKADPNLARNNNINLKEAAHNGDVVLFTLDSSNYGQIAAVLGNLIIQDLKTVSSELRQDPSPQPFQVLIDEFQAIGSDNIIGLINKSRDADMPVSLSTQSLGDLKAVAPAFLEQLIGIVGSFIIHRANASEDAKLFAGLTGMTARIKKSEAYSTSGSGMGKSGIAHGAGMLQEVEETTVKADEILKLQVGELVYVNKYISPMRVVTVQCIPQDKTEYAKAHPDKVNRKLLPIVNKDFVPEDLPFGLGSSTPEIYDNAPIYAPIAPTRPVEDSDNTPTKDVTDFYKPSPGTNRAPDMDRLGRILNSNPNDMLPTESVRNDEYTVKVMPPSVAEPLNIPKIDPNGLKRVPPLPSLPPLPPKPGASLPTPNTQAVPNSIPTPSLPKPTNLNTPSLPKLPNPTDSQPISKNDKNDQKDEFDF